MGMEQKGIQRCAQEFDALQAISARFHEVAAAAHEDDLKSCKQGEDGIDADVWSPLNKLCDMTAVPAGKVDVDSEEAQRKETEAQTAESREIVLSSLVAS